MRSVAQEQALTPDDIASVRGISCRLVAHRMDVGDLRFHNVGDTRCATVKDVLALKTRLDAQQVALEELADNTEAPMRDHGL